MTQRDGQASAPVDEAPLQQKRARAGLCSAEIGAPTSGWVQIFQSASPAERDRLLALARHQGFLFSNQLPSLTPAPVAPKTALAQVLDGSHSRLTPVRPRPIEVMDAELDPIQCDAVAKALQTPDVCVIQGLPGTGKRRVAIEIIHQAAMRGDRVLLLAPRTGALDSLLERIALPQTVLAVRCLNPDEDLERLPPSVRRLTFAAQLAALKEQALRHAAEEASASQQRVECSHRQESLWSRLQELAEAHILLLEREEALNRQKTLLADTVAGEAAEAAAMATARTTFQASLVEALAPLGEASRLMDDSLTDLQNQFAVLQKEQHDRESRLNLLRPITEAKRDGRWWTLDWWRATFSSRPAQAAALAAQEQQAQTILDQRNEEARELVEKQTRLRDALQGERLRLVAVETDCRRAALDREENALRHDRNSLDLQWQEAWHGLGPSARIGQGKTPEAVRAAIAAWRANLRQEEQQAEFARLWADALTREADQMHLHLRTSANLVACTPRALANDDQFGDGCPHACRFDLLIVMEAQDVTDEELARAAKRAGRIALIGEPVSGLEPKAQGISSRFGAPRPSLLARLWNALHCDPRRLPYAWFREGERLCCRLRPITSLQRQWLEREELADYPEIELRILAQPRKAPVLVEVLFPPDYDIQQAKQNILQELQECPISAGGSSVRWDEQPDRVVLWLAEDALPNSAPIVLGAGIREMVGMAVEGHSRDERPPTWQTCCVEFERAAGWHRERAEEWTQQHLGLVDLGRTARLDKPYRMQPDLARFLSYLLFDGGYRTGATNGEAAETPNGYAAWGPPVEFVPVTAEPNGNGDHSPTGHDTYQGGNRATASRALHSPRSGLELSLADPFQRSALPADLRTGLPQEGIVNFAEARVVVHALETLIQHPALRATTGGRGRMTIGVVAFSSAQAELLRRMIDQSPNLLAADVEFLVATPETMRDRECLATLVSLTRSPVNRTDGAGPRRLIWALTRATNRLLIFGDPGALERRSHRPGTVHEREDAAARQEREILGRLVQYVHGIGPCPHAFQLREGSWT